MKKLLSIILVIALVLSMSILPSGITASAETKLPAAEAVGCVSHKEYEILGLPKPENTRKGQRKNCLCIAEKKDMLPFKYNQTGYNHCYGCLYCYWQTEKDRE